MRQEQMLLTLFGVGALAGLGRALASTEKPTWQVAVGRAVTTGILSLAAGSVLLWMPGTEPGVGLLGLGAALASLGTSGVERVLQKYLGGK